MNAKLPEPHCYRNDNSVDLTIRKISTERTQFRGRFFLLNFYYFLYGSFISVAWDPPSWCGYISCLMNRKEHASLFVSLLPESVIPWAFVTSSPIKRRVSLHTRDTAGESRNLNTSGLYVRYCPRKRDPCTASICMKARWILGKSWFLSFLQFWTTNMQYRANGINNWKYCTKFCWSKLRFRSYSSTGRQTRRHVK